MAFNKTAFKNSIRYVFSWKTVYGYSLAVIIASVIPLNSSGRLDSAITDKIVHFLMYAVLSFISANTFRLEKRKFFRIFGFFYAFSLGLLMEAVQLFIPYRSFDILDLLYNFLGAVLGCLLRVL